MAVLCTAPLVYTTPLTQCAAPLKMSAFAMISFPFSNTAFTLLNISSWNANELLNGKKMIYIQEILNFLFIKPTFIMFSM